MYYYIVRFWDRPDTYWYLKGPYDLFGSFIRWEEAVDANNICSKDFISYLTGKEFQIITSFPDDVEIKTYYFEPTKTEDREICIVKGCHESDLIGKVCKKCFDYLSTLKPNDSHAYENARYLAERAMISSCRIVNINKVAEEIADAD